MLPDKIELFFASMAADARSKSSRGEVKQETAGFSHPPAKGMAKRPEFHPSRLVRDNTAADLRPRLAAPQEEKIPMIDGTGPKPCV